MRNQGCLRFIVPAGLLTLAALACGPLTSSSSTPQAPIAPITLGNDLTQVNLCQAIPPEDIEAVMGRKLTGAPQSFEYYDTTGSSGCWYDAGKDSQGAAHFGYVVLTPAAAYNEQPLYQKADVAGLGQSAYFNNGADARQLWVKLNDQTAFVVAFGDEPEEDGAKAIAKLVLAAIQ